MKDFLTKETRELLADKLFMSENCDVADYLKRIDSRLSDKKKEYDEFVSQFQNGVVNFKKLFESFNEAVMLCHLKNTCNLAYEEQKHEIKLKLAEYECLLDSFLPEEEED